MEPGSFEALLHVASHVVWSRGTRFKNDLDWPMIVRHFKLDPDDVDQLVALLEAQEKEEGRCLK